MEEIHIVCMTWAKKKWIEMDCIQKSTSKSFVAKASCIHSFCVLTWMGIAVSCTSYD